MMWHLCILQILPAFFSIQHFINLILTTKLHEILVLKKIEFQIILLITERIAWASGGNERNILNVGEIASQSNH